MINEDETRRKKNWKLYTSLLERIYADKVKSAWFGGERLYYLVQKIICFSVVAAFTFIYFQFLISLSMLHFIQKVLQFNLFFRFTKRWKSKNAKYGEKGRCFNNSFCKSIGHSYCQLTFGGPVHFTGFLTFIKTKHKM